MRVPSLVVIETQIIVEASVKKVSLGKDMKQVLIFERFVIFQKMEGKNQT